MPLDEPKIDALISTKLLKLMRIDSAKLSIRIETYSSDTDTEQLVQLVRSGIERLIRSLGFEIVRYIEQEKEGRRGRLIYYYVK